MSSNSSTARLDSLQGLHTAKRIVLSLLEPSSETHAVLLYGASGSGKTTLAEILAQGWLCSQPAESGGCGECQSCKAVLDGQNSDLLWVRPGGASNTILINMIVDGKPVEPGKPEVIPIERFLRTMPILSRNKVVIIEDADRIYHDSVGSLLKTLEEPQPYARFALTSSSIGNVRPTVVSRCISIKCSLPDGLKSSIGDGLTRTRRYELLNEIDCIVDTSIRGQIGPALRYSDQLRAIADRLAEAETMPKRNAQAQVIEYLADSFARRGEENRCAKAIETHRRVVMNGSFGLNLDALFAGF